MCVLHGDLIVFKKRLYSELIIWYCSYTKKVLYMKCLKKKDNNVIMGCILLKVLMSLIVVDIQLIQNGYTPLHDAAVNGHADIANLLLKKGADVKSANKVRS